MQKEGGFMDDLVRTSVGFLETLFRSLRADSRVPWQQYYTLAREASRRDAEKGIPLESVMEGLAVFRRSVMARGTEDLARQEDTPAAPIPPPSRPCDTLQPPHSPA